MRNPVAIAVLFVTLLAATTPVAAQKAVESPHGPLRDACETCHTASGWEVPRIDEDFDHARTGFALDGAHRAIACVDCHADLRFAGTDDACVACHTDVHRAELGTDCAFCHTTHSFLDQAEIRRMHRQTRFALTGAHAGADCETCHVPRAEGGLTYLGVSTECIDCHREAYLTVDEPDHVAGEFTERCDACHSTASFVGGFFNHERQLAGTSAVCVDCHRSDYDGAQDPNHVTSGFPLDCGACHGTRTWYGAFFAHDDQWFPIFSGRHQGEWDDCVDCHTVPSNYAVFDCLNCHPHSDRTETDNHHDEERDYRYDSNACYDCHPRGRE